MDQQQLYQFLSVLLALAVLLLLVNYLKARNASRKFDKALTDLRKRHEAYRAKMDPLTKYQVIADAEAEATRVRSEASALRERAEREYEAKIKEAEEFASSELKEARAKAKETRERAEQQLQDAYDLANKIQAEAEAKATEIAGGAWEAKQNAEQYEATVKAMKNIIKGYGDEYLIPSHSVLDELAAEYNHKEAGQELAKIRTLIKSMIKNNEAAECDYVEPYRRTTAIEFVLDAFNGKVDSIMSRVKHDNYGTLLQQLEDALRIVNHNGQAFRNARIQPRYYDAVVDQLKLAVAVRELQRIDQEEQRRIKEQMREEERARREFEKALRDAEKEERLLQKAMQEAEKKLAAAADEERALYESQLAALRQKLAEAEEREKRAKSMAEQTKRGHVYVISNIGSFGEGVFKIGLTRRLEPLDRVRELGDASVPFEFDVHAMIYSEDAPALEHSLQHHFQDNQVNKVNPRKEFFRIPITTIREHVNTLGLQPHWTMKAEAVQYRETLQIERRMGLRKEDSVSANQESMTTDAAV